METTHCKWLNQFVQTYFEPLVTLRCQSSENPVTEKKQTWRKNQKTVTEKHNQTPENIKKKKFYILM